MPVRRVQPYLGNVPTDDEVARMVHELEASRGEAFRWQSLEEPCGLCGGSAWSAALVAETWHEILPDYPEETVRVFDSFSGEAGGFVNRSLTEPEERQATGTAGGAVKARRRKVPATTSEP